MRPCVQLTALLFRHPRVKGLIRWQYDHRARRETQVLDALKEGRTTAEAITESIYPRDLKPGLKRSAQRNVTTHLAKLTSDGVVEETPANFRMM